MQTMAIDNFATNKLFSVSEMRWEFSIFSLFNGNSIKTLWQTKKKWYILWNENETKKLSQSHNSVLYYAVPNLISHFESSIWNGSINKNATEEEKINCVVGVPYRMDCAALYVYTGYEWEMGRETGAEAKKGIEWERKRVYVSVCKYINEPRDNCHGLLHTDVCCLFFFFHYVCYFFFFSNSSLYFSTTLNEIGWESRCCCGCCYCSRTRQRNLQKRKREKLKLFHPLINSFALCRAKCVCL